MHTVYQALFEGLESITLFNCFHSVNKQLIL